MHTPRVILVTTLIGLIVYGFYLRSEGYFDTWQDKRAELAKHIEENEQVSSTMAMCVATRAVDAAEAAKCPLKTDYTAIQLLEACMTIKPELSIEMLTIVFECYKKEGDTQ